jgi:hypothetical protein
MGLFSAYEVKETTVNAFSFIAQETENLKATERRVADSFSASANLRFLTVLTPSV